MDDEGYPLPETLQCIEAWPLHGDGWADLRALLAYVREHWHFAEWGWGQDGEWYYLSTGGWSGNEDIIAALQRHRLFWMLCFQSQRRGGHFTFTTDVSAFDREVCPQCGGSGMRRLAAA